MTRVEQILVACILKNKFFPVITNITPKNNDKRIEQTVKTNNYFGLSNKVTLVSISPLDNSSIDSSTNACTNISFSLI